MGKDNKCHKVIIVTKAKQCSFAEDESAEFVTTLEPVRAKEHIILHFIVQYIQLYGKGYYKEACVHDKDATFYYL